MVRVGASTDSSLGLSDIGCKVIQQDTRPRRRQSARSTRPERKALNRVVEDDFIRRASDDLYREKIRSVYGGPQGAILAVCSFLSLHTAFGERLIRSRRFDLTGKKSILDVGSGAGQIASHLLRYADGDAQITCLDLSLPMLRRARQRLNSSRPEFVAGDLASLPFADESFDAITCGYVLEHLADPRPGLKQLARVLRPGGRMFLLTTEDNFAGAWTSRLWCCRTYNRSELRQICEESGFVWRQELWYTPVHRLIRAGGICVELERRVSQSDTRRELSSIASKS